MASAKKKKEKEKSTSKSSSPPPPSSPMEPEKPVFLSAIASPLAKDALAAKVLKTVRAAVKRRSIRRGVKEVVKALRKASAGSDLRDTVCIIAGNISPIDVITHLPILCEEKNVPYCYVKSKEDLGSAISTKRPTSCVLISKKSIAKKAGKVKEDGDADDDDKYAKDFDKVKKKIEAIQVEM